jgi:four helix bundle protein
VEARGGLKTKWPDVRTAAMSIITHHRELSVYQNAMAATMRLFELTKHFPRQERFTLIDQIRRSSRSVCANLAEAWRKRRYEAAFVAQLNDAEGEAAETQVHAEIASRYGYLNAAEFQVIDEFYHHILGQLVTMIQEPHKWLLRKGSP